VGDDDEVPFIRFDIDPRLFNPAPKAAPDDPETNRVRDPSFIISGVSYPRSDRISDQNLGQGSGQALDADIPSSAPSDVTQTRAPSRGPRREPLCYISLRIPRKALDEIDAMAREEHTSMSEVVRRILANAVRRRKRSTTPQPQTLTLNRRG
jgi:hypothetical protein